MNERSVKPKSVMNRFITPQNDVALRILEATDELMAREGVQNISTHKIAKIAKVSVGTIYLYFKDKDDLLNQLVLYLFDCYHSHIQHVYDANLPLFEQYQALWRSTWQFMQQKPNVVQNFYQYESLPSYRALIRRCIENEELVWNQFVKAGQAQGVIASLDRHILFALTMKVPWEIMRLQTVLDEQYSEAVIDEIILRTWKAITF